MRSPLWKGFWFPSRFDNLPVLSRGAFFLDLGLVVGARAPSIVSILGGGILFPDEPDKIIPHAIYVSSQWGLKTVAESDGCALPA